MRMMTQMQQRKMMVTKDKSHDGLNVGLVELFQPTIIAFRSYVRIYVSNKNLLSTCM